MELRKVFANCWILAIISSISALQGKMHFPPKGYDNKERPYTGKGAIDVSFHLYIESFGSIDIAKMEYEVYGYIIGRWKDPRLTHDHQDGIIFSGSGINPIWVPDIYCINCRDSNLESGRNEKQSMVIVSKDGSIYYSVGIKLTASCPIDLINFPFDFQRCPLHFSSYSYNTSNLSLSWFGMPTIKRRSLEQFNIVGETMSISEVKYSSGYFSVAEASFGLSRRIGFYVLQIYVPTVMLVCLSWSVFFMRTSTIGERITIGVTLFLAMVFLHGYSNASLPKVSYIKAVDWFIVVSLASILLIIIESIITEKFWRSTEDDSEQNEIQNGSVGQNGTSGGVHEQERPGEDYKNGGSNGISMITFDTETGQPASRKVSYIARQLSRGSHLDNEHCRIPLFLVKRKPNRSFLQKFQNSKYDLFAITVFPLLYLVFNIWYWIHFTTKSKGVV